jgi:hypothetical protein
MTHARPIFKRDDLSQIQVRVFRSWASYLGFGLVRRTFTTVSLLINDHKMPGRSGSGDPDDRAPVPGIITPEESPYR